MTQAADERSLAYLLRDLAGGTSTLLRQELSLARAETQDKLHQMIAVLVAMVGGALLAFAGLIILLDALVYGLVEAGMERWLAALIVGGFVVLVGLLMVRKAQSDLTATGLAHQRPRIYPQPASQLARSHGSPLSTISHTDSHHDGGA